MPYIPPAYTNVKIFKDPKSKIYAYGYDKKGRKQILYNQWFIDKQREQRFKHVMGLRDTMKELKARIDRVLRLSESSHDKEVQICVILKLMMLCNFRIGNMKYLKDNGSYGLTTLDWKHIKLHSKAAQIEFIGKKGVLNKSTCLDEITVKILRRMRKCALSDKVFAVSSKDVNKYVRSFNENMTTKDIRTWHANYLYIKYYKQAIREGQLENKARIIAITRVAASLHNTPAVCKKNYLLPELIGTTGGASTNKANTKPTI
jgi:DNA topoisomerase-1